MGRHADFDMPMTIQELLLSPSPCVHSAADRLTDSLDGARTVGVVAWWLLGARRVFLQGGRIAFVISPAFDHTMTAVRLFNGFHCPTGTQPSAAGKNAAAFPSTVSTETDHLTKTGLGQA